jgi:hypothetical protein
MRIDFYRARPFLFVSVLSFLLCFTRAAEAASPTMTTLSVSSSGSEIAQVASGSVVTFTAKVKSGTAAVTAGQVEFCEAMAKTCTDIHLLGLAQLTSAGTAVMKFVPGIGQHEYKAVFTGTPNGSQAYSSSFSKNVKVTVTGKFPTATSLAASGNAGDYTLTATVTGLVNGMGVTGPSGKVSFVDTSDGKHVLGRPLLGAAELGLGFFNSDTPGTNPYPQSVAIADFNGDGKLDLAIPVYSIFTALADANILLGNGDGTFTAAPAFPASGQNANNAAVGDFNGDGKPDLAISLPDANQVLVVLGNGDGTFTAETPITANAVFSVVSGEFNGDGKADLAVVAPGAESIQILLGNGDGTFTPGTPVAIAGVPVALAVADFNGDGIADLAVANYSTESVNVFLGRGDGTFEEVPSSPATSVEPLSIVAGDFNGDGVLDLAVTNQNYGYPNPGIVTVLLGKGDGTFVAAKSLQTGSIPYTASIADINGDGIADLVTANAGGNNFDVFLGVGDGTFTAPLTPSAGTNPVGGGVGDFNGDGLPDLAAANNTSQTVTVVLTQETQTASAVATGVAPKGAGQHLVDASYKGNADYQGSTSLTVTLEGSDEPRQ